MNIIEQAAKRMEELRRAGVDVPWGAVGIETTPGQPAGAAPIAAPVPTSVPADLAPAAPVAPVAPAATAAQPAPHAPQPGLASHTAEGKLRRSREVELDLDRLAAKGFLVPGIDRSMMEEQYRIVKRPLLKNATGESAAPIVRGNLIMVTSALPGEGKTFSAINLAMSMAMELDHTVLLVDADVVRPAVLDRLGLPPAKGLLDVLTGRVKDMADVMLRTNIPKLTVLPAGTASSRTTELLASGAMEDLLDELARSYQDRIIIFDAPPLLPSTESRVLATRMGQVVVVVEADVTNTTSITQAFATLESCPVVMSVLNKCRGKVANTAYGYYAV
jgi:protein-tyrosine kinase